MVRHRSRKRLPALLRAIVCFSGTTASVSYQRASLREKPPPPQPCEAPLPLSVAKNFRRLM